MPTLLTTRKMAPALAARVEASVRGRRAKPGGSNFAPRTVSVLRLVILVVAVGAAVWLVVTRRRDHSEMEGARAALLDAVRAQGAALSNEDKASVARAELWLTRFAGASYEGDLVAGELRGQGALAATLARPIVYVRGPLRALRGSATIADAAAASFKDAFVVCLLDPPASRTEKAMLGKVRAAYAGGAVIQQSTANVHRLHDAVVGLPLLLPPWAARVQAAEERRDLARLERELAKAPLEEAKKAATAELLLFAIDEPGDGKGPTELDGERAHDVRIGLVDVSSAQVLLRLRKHVDPSALSTTARAEFASGLDGCGLALDVREAARP